MLVYRRQLLAGVTAAALVAAVPALADTRFVNFAFPATGAPTSRTMPARLAEIKNVLDFGADNTGVADSRAAIQAAIDWTAGADRGTILFPPGTYVIGSPGVTFSYDGALTINFQGAGATVSGNFNGYLFNRLLVTPNNYDTQIVFERFIFRNNGANGGCVRIGSSTGSAFRDCQFNSFIGINTEDAVGVSSRQLLLSSCKFFTTSGNTITGSRGIIAGGGGVIEASGGKAIDVGYRLYGNGWCIAGGRWENTNAGFELGIDSGGNDVGLNGISIRDHTFEGNWTNIDIVGTTTGWSFENCTGASHAASNSGAVQNIKGGQYGYRYRAGKVGAGLSSGLSPSGPYDFGAIWIEDQTNRPFMTFLNCTPTASSGTVWQIGTLAQNACFINNASIAPIWTFASLPSGANVREGDRYDISDANTTAWGANVTAGGSTNRCNVRWNGSNWTVVAI